MSAHFCICQMEKKSFFMDCLLWKMDGKPYGYGHQKIKDILKGVIKNDDKQSSAFMA